MKLIIDKLAKIDNAVLDFNGITVIAGANNTGKSTVGKALLAMFTAFSNLDDRVNSARRRKYHFLLQDFEERFVDDEKLAEDLYGLAADLVSKEESIEGLSGRLAKAAGLDANTSEIGEWVSRFKEVADLSVEKIKCQEVLNTFAGVFNSQCSSYLFPDTHPTITLELKKKKLSVEITPPLPKCIFDVKIQHQAFYIDSPDSLVDLRDSARRDFFFSVRRGSRLSLSLVRGVREKLVSRKDGDSSSVDDLLIKTKFEQVEKQLKALMGGTLSYSKEQELVFIDDLFPDQPLKIDNLSQGVKSMALLQAAFMKGTIGDFDVLILDEPEIHLHPEWQVRYAELVVLLQKAFNLTVLLTSHSPDFIQAIRLYAKKHKINDRLNGYLSKRMDNGSVEFHDVSQDNWDDVFDSFGLSFDELMQLRVDLEGPNERDCAEQA